MSPICRVYLKSIYYISPFSEDTKVIEQFPLMQYDLTLRVYLYKVQILLFSRNNDSGKMRE